MTPRHLLEPGRLAGAALLKAQSDSRLVDMTRAGNDRAFEAIVERYKGQLLRYCSRILPDGRGEDAVQQTFLKAYKALHDDTTPLSLRAWLFGIAHNVSLNVLRQRGSDHEPLEAHPLADEPAHATIEKRERFREVLAAVAALPPGQRDALVLRELEGRGHDEIARELGVTGGAARQLISRARSGIRAAAAAVIPFPLLMRLTDGSVPPPTAMRLAELTAAGGGVTIAKVVATAAVGTTLVGGAIKGPDIVSAGRDGGDDPVPAAEASVSDDGVDSSIAQIAGAQNIRRHRAEDRHGRDDGEEGGNDDRRGESGDDSGGRGSDSGDDGGGGESGGDDHHGDSGGGDDDSHSGSGGSGGDDGSDSGSGDGGSDDGLSGIAGGDDGGSIDDRSGSGTDGTSDSSGSGSDDGGTSGGDDSSGSGDLNLSSGDSVDDGGLSDNSGPGSTSDDN